MNRLKYLLSKYKIIIIIVLTILIFVILLIFNGVTKAATVEITDTLESNKVEEIKEDVTNIEKNKYKVDIKGMIKNPGVYELEENSRVIDVINKAGGLIDSASTEYINLSKKISDEMVIIIYSKEDINKFKDTDKNTIYIKYECDCPDNINDACISDKDVVNTVTSDSSNDKLVSINNGTIEELMTLSGIGESKAKAIIEYREKNGEFKKIEDIINVSGIGESAYTKIKDYLKL